ncbi:hypothetical protein BC629DRAFT_1596903 [Irpex lacteus]|nr:hypothetical protein BC629DRAFT_1596903 [Irpex lacteus]
MPRKRQRLMIESSTIPEKRKAAAVEEVEDNDDHILGGQGDRVDPMQLYASIETPDAISPHDRPQWLQATDLDPQSPTSLRHFPRPPINTTAPTPRPQYKDRSDSAPVMSLTTTQAPQQTGNEWSSMLQTILNSPAQMQRLMQALAAQQNQPAPTMPLPNPEPIAPPPVDPNQQVTTYDPGYYDFSRYRPESAPSPPHPSSTPLCLKTYHDADEINADVDALQYIGADRCADEYRHSFDIDQRHTTGPSADFDFDAFFNELSSKNGGEPGFTDVTGRYDPTTQINGTSLGDASTDQLTAFLDDVSSDTASLHDPHEQPPKVPSKRKSDVADLPPSFLSADPVAQSPKTTRRKR